MANSTRRGRILMGTLPEMGQLNPLFAITEVLVAQGHEVHFASGSMCKKRIETFNAHLAKFPDTKGKEVIFHDLGGEALINDHNYLQNATPQEFLEYKELIAKGPRNAGGLPRLLKEILREGLVDRKNVTFRFLDIIKDLNPDILVLDQFTSCLVEAARMAGVDYIINAPASPLTLALPSPLSEPLSGTDLAYPLSFTSKLKNLWYFLNVIPRILFHPSVNELRAYRRDVLKLKSCGLMVDSSPFSKFHPSWTNQKAIICPNLDFRQSTPFDKVVFVGPCVQRASAFEGDDSTTEDKAVKQWLDIAEQHGDNVVYLNLGTIFRYNQADVDAIFEAVRLLNKRKPGGRSVYFLWKVPRGKVDLSAKPPQIKIFEWLQDPLFVYQHKAVKVFSNHGGGNSFNEGLAHGMPQLILSQWFDTIDYGVAARVSGIGLSSEHPGRLSGPDICEKLTRLLTEKSFVDKAALWSVKCRAAGGAAAAAGVVSSCLQSKWDDRANYLKGITKPPPQKRKNSLKYFAVLSLAVILSLLRLHTDSRVWRYLSLTANQV